MLVGLDNDVKSFKTELYRLVWYMRGGVSINDLLYNLSYDDRITMYNIIKDNIEMTKAAKMPLL